jgi:predicted aconitase with swiveling domain
MIAARILHAGTATGSILRLEAPLSLWGGFEPLTGEIVDAHHPQRGINLAGRIVLMAQSRGSGTAPGALAESIRSETGPAALIMIEPDVNLAIGAEVAATLYGRAMPILTVSPDDFALIATWPAASIGDDGIINQIPLPLVGRG